MLRYAESALCLKVTSFYSTRLATTQIFVLPFWKKIKGLYFQVNSLLLVHVFSDQHRGVDIQIALTTPPSRVLESF